MQRPGRSTLIGLLAAAGLAGAIMGGTALLSGRHGSAPGPSPGGRALYAEHCAECHGRSGKGDGPAAAVIGQRLPDFSDAAAMRKVDDAFLAAIIKKGGSQFGRSNAMPAWGMKLSDAEIGAIVAYIRSLAQPASSASPSGG